MQLESTQTHGWRWLLAALVAGHIVLSLLYAARTPYRQAGVLLHQNRAAVQDVGAPDERQHANYVQHLIDGRGFPAFNPDDPSLYESYQSHQPPLYYVLAAAWAKAAGVADVGEPSAGMRLRALSCLLGGATIAGVFFLGLWGTRRVSTALAAAALAAALPMLCALDGAVGNDALLIAVCTWTLAVCAKGLQRGWTPGTAATGGVLLGLALLTKTSAIALVPVCIYALFASLPKPVPRLWAISVCSAIALVLPWWIRNMKLYGDPLAMGAFGSAFSGTAQARTFIDAFGAGSYWFEWVGWWTARSLVGVFGYMDIFLPSPLYVVLLALMATGLIGSVWARRSADNAERAVLAMAMLFALFVGALFLRFNAQYFQGQGRYLLPAIAAGALLVAVGWTRVVRGRVTGVWMVAGALLATNLYALAILPQEFAKRTGGEFRLAIGSDFAFQLRSEQGKAHVLNHRAGIDR